MTTAWLISVQIEQQALATVCWPTSCNHRFIVDRRGVTAGKRFAVQHDFAFRDMHPRVAIFCERVRNALSGSNFASHKSAS